MHRDPRLDQIPSGCTCRGVARAIIEYLLQSGDDADGKTMLDIPCGEGALISSLRLFFPKAVVRGCDVRMPKTVSPDDFSTVDASRPFTVFPGTKFDFVFSVSGVMEFDNTLQFFARCRDHLRDGGLFLVTNDNVVAIRDRIAYFWLGKVRQYQLFVTQGQPTWKVIPIHNMVRILQDAGFRIREIRCVFAVEGLAHAPLGIARLSDSVSLHAVHENEDADSNAARDLSLSFTTLPSLHYCL